MWAFCAGMKRSGSTLQYQLVAEIVERKGIGRRIGYVEPEQFASLNKKHTDTRELLVVKTHAFLPEANQLCNSGQALVFCVYRDLRDIAVSLYNKYGTPIEVILEKGQLHACVSDFKSWTALPGLTLMRYEQMIANLPLSVAQIAEHLGVRMSEHECEQVANGYSHEKQQERIQELRKSLEARGQAAGYDSTSLLHQNHIHSGATGQWQQTLTTDQIREIEKCFGSWLEEHHYAIENFDSKKSNGTSILRRLKQLGRYLISSSRNSNV